MNDQDYQERKKRSPKQIALIVLCAVLGVIFSVLLIVTIYFEVMMGRINREVDNSTMSAEEYQEYLDSQKETADPEYTGATVNPEDVDWGETAATEPPKDEILNILLIGQDRRPGEGRTRSDAIMLCTLDLHEKTLAVTSFMRDMYVQIPGYQDDRINSCYPLGGMKLLDDCLCTNFGIHVDGNVEVDFGGFAAVIDAVGGVELDLTQAEAQHLNGKYGWNLPAGTSILNGEQALGHARNRDIGNSDFERTNRQRKVINALLEKCKTLSVLELHDLLSQVLPMITTDLSNSEIMDYASDVFPIVSEITMDSLRIPADQTYQYANIGGKEVLLPDLEANRQILEDRNVKG